MTKLPGDRTPEPPEGRAAERLRMFEDARASSKPDAPREDQKVVPPPKQTKRREKKKNTR